MTLRIMCRRYWNEFATTSGHDVQKLQNYTRSLMTAKGFCDILRYKIKKQGDARKGKAMFTVIFGSYLNSEHLDALRKYEPCLISVCPVQDNKSRINCMRI